MTDATQWPGQEVAWPGQEAGKAPPLAFRAQPADDPPLPTGTQYGGSEYGDIGPGASFNQGPQPAPTPSPPPAPPAGAPVAVGDTVVNADDAARVNAPPANPPIASLSDLRDRIQQGDISVLKSLAPSPDAGWLEKGARYAAMTGVHGLASLAEMPINALMGLAQGPSGAVTINPATNTLGLTPEAMTTTQMLTPGVGYGGRDVRFSGADAFKREAPSTLEQAGVMKPAPVTLEELNAAINRAPQNQMMPGEAPPPSGPVPSQPAPEAAAPTAEAPQPAVATSEPAPTSAPVTPEDNVWVGSTVNQVQDLVQQNAAQGGPASLSAAATPEQLAAMSPDMAKAYRRMAEVNRVVSPIEGENTSTIVPGSVPTKAEGVGSPEMSQQERLVAERKPELFTGPNGRLTQNNAARLNLYDEMTPSDPQIQTLNEDQAAQAKADTAIVNRNAGPVDGAPVAAQLKQLLSDPRIVEQPDVVKVLKPIHDALYDADGNLKTDIQSYWGMHDNLMTALAKAKDPLNASSSEKFAFNQLVDAKNAIDGAMSKASGGAFQTFLDNQRAFFQQKNAATILRDFRSKPGMINPKTGFIQPNAFHRFVTDLAVRRGRPGIDPAMDIPDDVMGKLMDINDDLKRSGRIDLGQPRGSQTNLFFALANGLGIAGAHSLVHAMGGGPFANVILQRGIEGVQSMMQNMRLNSLARESLNYPPEPLPPNPNPPGQFIPPSLRNPLGP